MAGWIILLLSCFSTVSSQDTVFVTLLCIAVEGARCRVHKLRASH